VSKPRHVLDGYKVLDFTQALAGPTVTRMLVEMGAEVIKVELPPNGDMSHGFPFIRNGRSAYYIQQNRGKKSLCVDVKNPAGLEIVKGLVPKVDVLVENYSPGAIARMGLGYDVVSKINPRLVMCSLSAFGQTGPLASEPGYDFIGQAYAGVTYMIGEPDGPPFIPMLGIGDVSTGVHAMGAIVAALLYRERTGKGQLVDVSLLDCYFHCHELNVQVYSASGGAIKPKRSGTQHPQVCVIGLFKAKTGYLVIMAITDGQWASLCRIMGKPELGTDPRFNNNAARMEHQGEVVKLIEDWLATTKSDEDAVDQLRAGRVPVAPVLSIEQAVNHPHLRQRRTVRTISDPVFGEFEAPSFPLRFSEFPDFLPLQAPTLGSNNREILETYLAYSPQQIKQLEEEGVLQSADR